MKIADAFAAGGGFVIVGGDPETADIADSEFEALLAKDVTLIKADGQRLKARVAEVNVSRSLIGQRNIMLGFLEGVDGNDDFIGGEVLWEH